MSRCARAVLLTTIGAALLASPAAAQPDDPAAIRQPDARDVAMTPLTDLNLAKDEIPPILLAAAADPYVAEGLQSCAGIGAAIAELDAVLGPDMDIHEDDRDRISWGKVATSAVGSFIPFRSVLRELTGAADHKRDFQAAIYTGAVRRGFLKGLGQQKGCAYPARPAFTQIAMTPQPSKRARGEEHAAAGGKFGGVRVGARGAADSQGPAALSRAEDLRGFSFIPPPCTTKGGDLRRPPRRVGD